MEWRFISPDYTSEIVWNDAAVESMFPGLTCAGGSSNVLELYGIPQELNGWYVACLFTDSDGNMEATQGASIEVLT